jgi:hypothetical protein
LEVTLMIAHAQQLSPQAPQAPPCQAKFLVMLPLIRRIARKAFRNVPSELRQELVAEVVANAYCAFVRLVQRGKADIARATPLARFAVCQVFDGRQVGTKMNVRDVSSRYCQQAKGVAVQPLYRHDSVEDTWKEIVVEDKRCGPAEIAASRIDFAAWLATLPSRHRRIATTLATGETTGAVARKFRVTAARISQLRRELQEAWEAFVGELPSAATC